MTPPQLDPSAAATAIFAILFGQQLAAYVGPYAVIVVGAAVGAAWSLGRSPVVSTNGRAFKHFLLMGATALIFSVPLSEWIATRIGSEDANWLFAPVAMFIAGVGGDWPKLIKWLWRQRRPSPEGSEK